jgi:CheY-like chemotaxis protein
LLRSGIGDPNIKGDSTDKFRRSCKRDNNPVLVLEDEPLARLAICADLVGEGYEVLTAANADRAIEILEARNDIHTIFTDMEMPGSMDGLKLASAIRDRWPR